MSKLSCSFVVCSSNPEDYWDDAYWARDWDGALSPAFQMYWNATTVEKIEIVGQNRSLIIGIHQNNLLSIWPKIQVLCKFYLNRSTQRPHIITDTIGKPPFQITVQYTWENIYEADFSELIMLFSFVMQAYVTSRVQCFDKSNNVCLRFTFFNL